MSKRILCKFFTHGACLKGEQCEFSHDWKDESSNVCTYYKKGSCSYGSRCRYDHVRVPQIKTSTLAASSNSLPRNSASVHIQSAVVASSSSGKDNPSSPSSFHLSASSKPFFPQATDDNVTSQNNAEIQPSDIPICSFAESGNCPHKDSCVHIHGDLCTICEKHCLHPFRPSEREEHVKSCLKNKKYLEALRISQDIECCVCLDLVLSKPKLSERKFGILSECDHSFCISCIRNWRSNSLNVSMDANSTLRTCPICRILSYFVIPSVIWYSSKEEKMEIIDTYKAKLRSIDCRHFNFGNGACSFGTSCFYKHAYRDGRLEYVVLRHLNSEDGNTVISKDVRLSDFFREMRL